ncbi:hypothetical protein [Clostridium sp. CCUG 7971]|uniref:hypothetical protein n=1 Tax=Clostridium sp. CCUG 7971 TaxID=2811414 RepID=UPI001ABA6EBB|nr:hypothetical protein [Clostridium sp. CCUG 7971]MBO3445522.1 hypothetical protein [Clostridium sp. CCUG 7971]
MAINIKLENNEQIISRISCCRKITNIEVVNSFLLNFFISTTTTPMVGQIVDDYILTLTNKNIYLESIYYSPWEGIYSVMNISKIPLKKVVSFDLYKDKKDEYVIIKSNENKELKLMIKDDKSKEKAKEIECYINKN